ncbi:recombinase family protein [Nesterenkonia jeotgali]|uniref:DNA invertase Pin-like site-specific DNA recombinase n=1 Tax=Nesterenkonia jeotgali TaxID=317018 RepID=A0A839FSN3_9MICC|nr:recombinase family protein [Nesterenkonia jeotgali]MBA8921332.1 DNA invertase Pin-like site-specific DNA recombinase [Nesterenkonia jeotgali]
MSNMSEPSIPAAIYVRISKDSEALGLGVARQEKECRELAERKGWQVVDVFKDNDVSATRSKVRPRYQDMIRAIEAGWIRGIVVYDVDRLTRTPRELEDVIEWADRHQLHLASVGGVIDLATPQGRMTARIKGTVAKHEAEQQSRRLKSKMRELREDGRYIGTKPYGWDWSVNEDGTKGKDLVLNPVEAAVVKECAERTLNGEKCHAIAQDLNKRGIPTMKNSRGWTSSHLRRMLLRPINAGFTIHDDVEYPGKWPQLTTRSQYDRLVAILTDPKRVVNRGTPNRYLLSGLIRCDLCGQAMRRNVGSNAKRSYTLSDGTMKKYEYERVEIYRCVPPGCNKVGQNREGVEMMVTEYVLRLLEREGVEIFGGDSARLEAAHERVEGLKAQMRLAAGRVAEGKMTFDQLEQFNATVQPQLDQAQVELRQATPDESMIEFTGSSARAAWKKADLDRKREVIRSLLNHGLRITVGQPGQKGSRRRKIEGRMKTFNPDTVYITADW